MTNKAPWYDDDFGPAGSIGLFGLMPVGLILFMVLIAVAALAGANALTGGGPLPMLATVAKWLFCTSLTFFYVGVLATSIGQRIWKRRQRRAGEEGQG